LPAMTKLDQGPAVPGYEVHEAKMYHCFQADRDGVVGVSCRP
jgi:hypothetical protein